MDQETAPAKAGHHARHIGVLIRDKPVYLSSIALFLQCRGQDMILISFR
jgi:hypothetical protein